MGSRITNRSLLSATARRCRFANTNGLHFSTCSDFAAPKVEDVEYADSNTSGESYGSIPYYLRKSIRVTADGKGVLNNSTFNKGEAFTLGERDRFHIRGLLPPRKLTMKEQVQRIEVQLSKEKTMIRKNRYMRDLLDNNETLFHRVLVDNIKELAPVIYTPTVGEACIEFGEAFRRPRGMYFNFHDQGDMAAMMYNWDSKDVQVIVVTDGSRILGLGDLGANGMGIPIGKLALYTSVGGVAPHRVLPIMFDAGTDNERLLNDPFYLGLKHRRLQGDCYYRMMDEFVQAVFNRYPKVLLQFEDFSSDKAMDILNRYRHKYCVFNDDIQGTGAVAVAGILGALRVQQKPPEDLKNQRYLIAGAGSAGIGVAKALVDTMVLEGMSREDAYNKFWICDINGVLRSSNELNEAQKPFGKSDETAGLSPLECARMVKPTVLLGLSACRGAFSEDLIREISKYCERPVIYPLSNPISVAECTNKEAIQWSEGRAIFASGSPFQPIEYNGKTYVPSQCNNMYIFPGLGFGAAVSQSKIVSDKMIHAASIAVAEMVTEEESQNGMVFPELNRIREVSQHVALKVALCSVKEGYARNETLKSISDEEEFKGYLLSKTYDPVYVPLVRKEFRHV